MKKNGYTLVELLAVLIIMGLLLVLTIPSFITVFNEVKRNNYLNKIEEIEGAAYKYGETIKDEIKNQSDTFGECMNITIDKLIDKGFLSSEDDFKNIIKSPLDNSEMNLPIYACYCETILDIKTYYADKFVETEVYHKGDKVYYDGAVYECMHTYPDRDVLAEEKGILSTYYAFRTTKKDKHDASIKNYFVKLEC